jgi:hypothetical protein
MYVSTHYALSALAICQRILPGPMAQAIIFRAFGAALIAFLHDLFKPGNKNSGGFQKPH